MYNSLFKIVADSASDILNFKGVDYESVPLKIITDENGMTNMELNEIH